MKFLAVTYNLLVLGFVVLAYADSSNWNDYITATVAIGTVLNLVCLIWYPSILAKIWCVFSMLWGAYVAWDGTKDKSLGVIGIGVVILVGSFISFESLCKSSIERKQPKPEPWKPKPPLPLSQREDS